MEIWPINMRMAVFASGGAAGLTDLGPSYPGYLMYKTVHRTIPRQDLEYIRQVYRNEHGARPH